MSAYTAVVRARFRVLLQYRAAAFAGFVTQLFWGFIQTQILEAFYRSSTAPQPIRMDQVITYVWLGQATLVLLPWNADNDVKALIRSGAVAYEMLRPIDLYNLWFSRAFAMRSAPTVLRAIPMFHLRHCLRRNVASCIPFVRGGMGSGHVRSTPALVRNYGSNQYLHAVDRFRRRDVATASPRWSSSAPDW